MFLIHENAHEFRHTKSRMCIIDVNADLLAKLINAHPVCLVMADNALHARRNKEILLDEAHTPPLKGTVIRIEIPRNLLNKSAVLVALLNLLLRQHAIIGKVTADLSVPETQRVDRRIVITDNGHIIGYRHDDHRILMDDLQPSIHITHVGVSAKFYIDGLIRLAVFPCKAITQPVIGQLDLIAANNLLLEQPVLVANAAPMSGQTVRCKRIDETCRKAPQTTVAKSRIRLRLIGVVEIELKIPQHIPQRILDAEVDEIGL